MNYLETANGYWLCAKHAAAWRDGGNNVAMRPITEDDVEEELLPLVCCDCEDEN